MHDSFTPIGGMLPMLHMMFGEVSPGGVGVGLMGMLIYALLAVFIAGLMVGRTPEYLGKKIQAPEMKLVVLYLIAMPVALLGFAAASVVLDSAAATIFNPGPHGLSEVLYNFASAANNNGSAFAGQGTGTDWYTMTQGLAMLMGRFFLIIPALAIGGSLVRKQRVPVDRRDVPDRLAAVRRARRRGDRHRRRPDVLPRPRPRPDRRAAVCTDGLDDHDHDLDRTGADRPPKVRTRPAGARSLFDGAIVRRAAARRLRQARPADAGPQPGDVRRRGRLGADDDPVPPRPRRLVQRRENVFAGLVVVFLWFTVLFANFAEAMAEGRGKAQAATLRKTRSETVGPGAPPDGARRGGPVVAAAASATCASSPPAR